MIPNKAFVWNGWGRLQRDDVRGWTGSNGEGEGDCGQILKFFIVIRSENV